MLDEGSKALIPAPLTASQVADIQRLSIAAFRAVDGAGMARVDFLHRRRDRRDTRERGEYHSWVHHDQHAPKMWEASGVSYTELVDRLITLALERHAESSSSAPASRDQAPCGRRLAFAIVVLVGIPGTQPAAAQIRLEPDGTLRRLQRVSTTRIFDARLDEVPGATDPHLPAARRRKRVQVLDAVCLQWWQIQLDP